MQSFIKKINDKPKSSSNEEKQTGYAPEQKGTISILPKHGLAPLKTRCARKTSPIETPYFLECIQLEHARLLKIERTLKEAESLLKENLTEDILKKVKMLLSVICNDIQTMERYIPKDKRKMTFFKLNDMLEEYIDRYRICVRLYNISVI